MSFRTFEYGKYADQIDGYEIRILYGYSIILNNSGSNSDIGSSNEWDDIEIKHTANSVFKWNCLRLYMANIRAALGQSPIILSANWSFFKRATSGGTQTSTMQLSRFLKLPSYASGTEATVRYRIDSTDTWTHDAWGPAEGDDIKAVPIWEGDVTVVYDGQRSDTPVIVMDVTDEMSYILRSGADWHVLFRIKPKSASSSNQYLIGFGQSFDRPFFSINYLNPIEYFAANSDGTIDLEHIAIETDDLADSMYLGAHQRGETGAAVKVFAKNLSGVAFSLAELWDDFPEWTDPSHSAGAGTGNLDYIVPLETAVSQRYTIDFYSTTEYEVKAESFRDYTTSLHPTIDADASWRGTTGTDFTAPSGGLTIPKECWQAAGLTAADEFEVLVLGNTTDTGWPADSNDMVQIAQDDGSGTGQR